MDFLGIALVGIGLVVPTLDYGLKKSVSRYVSVAATALALVLSVGLLSLALSGNSEFLYSNALKFDVAGAFLFVIVSIGAFFVTVASFKQTREWTTAPSYFSLLLLITVGVYYMISVNDLVLLLSAWALVSVASYALIGIKKDERSLEGASKYALMGIGASAFMLFGIAILIGLTGTTNIGEIAASVAGGNSQMVLMAVIMLAVAFGFKVGVVPFHGWLPDVYGSVDPLLVSFIAAIIKVSGVTAFLRILVPLAPALGDRWFALFAILAIVTMTFGNVAALAQKNVQRMMGYSSLAHVGYMLVGFAAVMAASGFAFGVQGVVLHLATYVLATVGIFVALAYMVEHGVGTDLNGIRELWRKMPIVSTSLVILVLSLIGMPPLLGFWSKFLYLFISPLQFAPWLTLIAILNTGVSIGYYGQIIRYMFLTKGEGESPEPSEKIGDPQVLVVLLCAVLTIVLGLAIGPIFGSILRV